MTLEIQGLDALNQILKELEPRMRNTVIKRGFKRTAAKMRTNIRKDARSFKRSGNLAKSIGVKYSRRQIRAWVGLTSNYYYKTLDLDSKRGAALHPWFKNSVERHSRTFVHDMRENIREALFIEAGKAHAKSLRGR